MDRSLDRNSLNLAGLGSAAAATNARPAGVRRENPDHSAAAALRRGQANAPRDARRQDKKAPGAARLVEARLAEARLAGAHPGRRGAIVESGANLLRWRTFAAPSPVVRVLLDPGLSHLQ